MRRETISAIRFGYGLRDGETPPVSTEALLRSAERTSRKSPRIALAARAEQLLANRMMRKESEEAKKRAQRALRETAIEHRDPAVVERDCSDLGKAVKAASQGQPPPPKHLGQQLLCRLRLCAMLGQVGQSALS